MSRQTRRGHQENRQQRQAPIRLGNAGEHAGKTRTTRANTGRRSEGGSRESEIGSGTSGL
jgi:hypothetical protein